MSDSPGYNPKTTKQARHEAESAFGGAEKTGFLARLMGRGTKGGIPSSPSGSTTAASVTPLSSSPLGSAQSGESASTTDAMGTLNQISGDRASTDAMGASQSTPTPRAVAHTPPPAPVRASGSPSPGTSVNVGPLIRLLVILGVAIYLVVTVVGAVRDTTKSISIPSFPGVTVPSTPFAPPPTAGAGSFDDFFTSNDFARALREARTRAGTGATIVAIRVDPAKATFIVRGSEGQKLITLQDSSINVISTGSTAAIPGGVALAKVDGAAPRRIVSRLKSRFGVAPAEVEYLAAIGSRALGGVSWTAHTVRGDTYSADRTGRRVSAPPG
jgi:hypothetical protein